MVTRRIRCAQNGMKMARGRLRLQFTFSGNREVLAVMNLLTAFWEGPDPAPAKLILLRRPVV